MHSVGKDKPLIAHLNYFHPIHFHLYQILIKKTKKLPLSTY